MDDYEDAGRVAPDRKGVALPATILFILIALVAAGTIAVLLTEPVDVDQPRMARTETPAAKPVEKPVVKPEAQIPPASPPVAADSAPPAPAPAAETPVKPESPPPAGETAATVPPAPPPEPKEETGTKAPAAPVASLPPQPRPEREVAPVVTPRAPDLPQQKNRRPLSRAPDPALVTRTSRGPLPVISQDGREAWRVYARPFNRNDKRPRIAVIIYGLGTSASATKSAIQALPGEVTLAFSPYAKGLSNWIAASRAAGHEVLMMVPMEPINYPDFDPGPQALITSASDKENLDRLSWVLSRGTGYVGVTDFMGSRFTSSTPHMQLFLKALSDRGLLFLESRTGAREFAATLAKRVNVPFAANTLYIDQLASRAAIDSQLKEAERIAKASGEVTIMGFPYPVTIERIGSWSGDLEKRGFVLAPVSAVARRDKKQ